MSDKEVSKLVMECQRRVEQAGFRVGLHYLWAVDLLILKKRLY